MTDDERREQGIKKAQKMQRIINAYHRIFNTVEGETVLEDLRTAFGTKFPAYLQVSATPPMYDETYGKIRDGQRSVIIHIENRLEAIARGDGNIGKPLVEVLTGVKTE
jgi:hypothetical protein